MNISDFLSLYSEQGQGQERWMERRAQQVQPANNQSSLSANLMGDYNPQPRYGQQNANPWQEQLWGQLFQQTDMPKKQNEPTAMKGGGGGGGK